MLRATGQGLTARIGGSERKQKCLSVMSVMSAKCFWPTRALLRRLFVAARRRSIFRDRNLNPFLVLG